MQTNPTPELWAFNLATSLPAWFADYDAIALTIQAAFAEREARLVGAITSTNAMACTPDGDGSHKITLHYPDTATAMAAFVQLSDVADGGMKDEAAEAAEWRAQSRRDALMEGF